MYGNVQELASVFLLFQVCVGVSWYPLAKFNVSTSLLERPQHIGMPASQDIYEKETCILGNILVGNLTHTIHVWYIYLHLAVFNGKIW